MTQGKLWMCPYCGGIMERELEERWKGWLTCKDCGATYNPNPTKLAPFPKVKQRSFRSAQGKGKEE